MADYIGIEVEADDRLSQIITIKYSKYYPLQMDSLG